MEQNIRLLDIQFTKIDCNINSYNKNITSELITSLGIVSLFDEEDKKKFAIAFQIGLNNEDNSFKLEVKAIAHFIANIELDQNFEQSAFVKINAPAIAFPYVRTFISNLTLNTGYNPIVLPSFNFVKLAEKNSDS